MKALPYILFGAILTVVTAVALGTILLRALSIQLYRLEERLLGFVIGSACLSGIMFALCAVRLVHKGVLLALSALVLAMAIRFGVHRPAPDHLSQIPRAWQW